MPLPVENILPGRYYRVKDDIPRHVLLIHEGQVTYVLRGVMAWTVLRSFESIASFAEKCEAEIDGMTLKDVA